ncbi:carboxymuconolactone decarboxylase family protein [Nocardia sp. GCM10030253]|uniref:carboxymuconolactone decarboxylase family protein n=1 Tax=Nocardia sp. GCM10030253 TaxID=3273404 RepID=UPI00363421AF
MTARMKNPAMVLPDAMKGINNIYKGIHQGGLSIELLELVALRASQINGCSACVSSHLATGRKSSVSDDKLFAVAAWRESDEFSEAERAALALTEVATRLADKSGDGVPDEIWDAVADHYDENQLAALVLNISIANFFNRVNNIIKEPAGAHWG